MKVFLKPEERLFVAVDFKTNPARLQGRTWVADRTVEFADELRGVGCGFKVNSVNRSEGYGFIDVLRGRGLEIFADLKLCDIGATLINDGALLRETKPSYVTVMCSAGVEALKAIKAELPDTKVLGVTVLTTLKEDEVQEMYGSSIIEVAKRFARTAKKAGLDGLICAPTETVLLREIIGDEMLIINPGVRPESVVVEGDDQNKSRVMTPYEAIHEGADGIVVGRPILQAKNRREATLRIIEEIARAVS